MFHLGLFMAFGIDEHLYHIIAIAGGVPSVRY